MPTKAFDPTTGRVSVEFRLPPEAGADEAWLCGDFNDWSLEATPLRRTDDGALVTTLELEPGRSYRFRYWLGNDQWENDWSADAYVENDFGGHDSMLTLPDSSAPPAVDPAADAPASSTLADPVTPSGVAAAKKAGAKKAAPAKKAGAKKAAPAKEAGAKKAAPAKRTAKKQR